MVDLLKLRASYTQVGAPVSRIGMTPGTYTDKIVGGVIIPNTLYPYTDFKAERTKSYEFGLSFKGLKGLSFDLTLYKSNTYNQTFLGTMPESSGYTGAYLQAGNVQNTGIEASLGYGHKVGEVDFSTNLVFSRNKNEIKEMVKDYKHPDLNYTFDIPEVSKGSTILKVGGSINDVYASKFFKKDGNGYVYVPETGEVNMEVGKPVFLGRTTPDFNMGWNASVSWRGLNFGFTFNGRFGGIVTSSTQAIMDSFGVSEVSAIARDNGGALLPNQGLYDAQKYYEMVGASGESELMGYYTYSATNIRLQQLSLGYRFPAKWFKGYIRGLSLTLIGNNLWMIYNKAPHDPELTPTTGTYGVGNDYFMQPSLRSFGASIKLSF
ncbi:TonB-dependent receptor [Bacteroides pyogenes JCM 10003]|nr:TonB-dependent receptor [Bacteroides pyogenes JCM 10003]